MSEIRAICFDAFGTLVEISDKRRPFHKLLGGEEKGRLSVDALTRPLNLREVAKDLAVAVGEARLGELERDLAAECASIRLRPRIEALWAALRKEGLRIGICSNLAQPYADPLLASLPGIPDALVFSYEVGFIKPHPKIYQLVCRRLALSATQILFVGDSPEADVLGPRSIGMPAMGILSLEAAMTGIPDPRPVESDPSPQVQALVDRLRQCVCS